MSIGFKGLATVKKLLSLAKFRKPCQKISNVAQKHARRQAVTIGKPVS